MAKINRQFPDLPFGMEMHEPAMLWALERRRYHTDDLKKYLADYFKLTKMQRSYRFKTNGLLAFSNYVDCLTEAWTLDNLHIGHDKNYRLTNLGVAGAELIKRQADGF